MIDTEGLIEDLVKLADRHDVGLTAYDLVLEVQAVEFDMDPKWYQMDELEAIQAAEELMWLAGMPLSGNPEDYDDLLDEMDALAEDANE